MASANWPWPPLLEVAVVSNGAVPASFAVASMLLRLPEDRREDVATGGDNTPAVLHVNVEDALVHLFVTPVG